MIDLVSFERAITAFGLLPEQWSRGAAWVFLAGELGTAALMLAGMIGAFGLAPDTTLERVPTERVVRDLVSPAIVSSTIDGGYWHEEQVRRGEFADSVVYDVNS